MAQPLPKAPKATGLKKRQAIDKASRTMLLWIIAASVGVSFFLVGAQFLYSQFMYNNAVYAKKTEAVSTLDQNLVNIGELKNAFGPLDAGTNPYVNSTKVLNALPRELDTSAFGSSLQQVIAPRSGVTLDSVDIQGAEESAESLDGEDAATTTSADPTPQEIKVTVTVVGSYDQLTAFIRDLELTIRPVKINTMSVTGSDANTRATLELTTYYQPSKGVIIEEEELAR